MNKTAETQMQNSNNLYERRNAKDKNNSGGGVKKKTLNVLMEDTCSGTTW